MRSMHTFVRLMYLLVGRKPPCSSHESPGILRYLFTTIRSWWNWPAPTIPSAPIVSQSLCLLATHPSDHVQSTQKAAAAASMLQSTQPFPSAVRIGADGTSKNGLWLPPAQMIPSTPPYYESVSVAAVHAPLESCLGNTASKCSSIHATTLNWPNPFCLLSRGEQVASPKMKCGCPWHGAQKPGHTCTPLS